MNLPSSSSSSTSSTSSSSSPNSTSSPLVKMLRSVNWSEKIGRVFGGHCGRILKILIVFVCALGVLIGIYSARSQRLVKESESNSNKLSSVAAPISIASTSKWVIVANPDDLSFTTQTPPIASSSPSGIDKPNGRDYVCTAANVAFNLGWKTIIIGAKVHCCRRPDCYAITKSQFLRMGYRSSNVLKNLTINAPYPDVYKETFRNLAFLWVIHRGAQYIFDAYVEEYQSAGISTIRFEEELNRQLQTLALDESLALVEERSRSRLNVFRNPYSHFGRPDVQLLPSNPGSNAHSHSIQSGHTTYAQYMNGHTTIASKLLHEYPTYRICEVRPPSIEKFLEIDEGWWDMAAPALVLPGDTMPPLCTRNTLFAPEVFWALPLLPDYSSGDNVQLPDVPQNFSRIPPWYIRGLWSQSLLEDLGGSIRLSLSKVPTLQLNKDYFFQKDKRSSISSSPFTSSSNPETNLNQSMTSTNTAGPSKLLKRWSCRSRSTFRCLTLMSKELSNSVYMDQADLAIIDAWLKDLKKVGYLEPSMLPKRRTHTNPCIGADGLLGVSFHAALVPKYELTREEYIADRNETLKSLVAKFLADEEIKKMEEASSQSEGSGARDKRETERPAQLQLSIVPPQENSTYEFVDWSSHITGNSPSKSGEAEDVSPSSREEPQPSKLTQQPDELEPNSYFTPPSKSETTHTTDSTTSNPKYHYKTYDELLSESESYSQRILPIENKPSLPNARASLQTMALPARNTKHFRAFLQQVVAKSAQEGHAARDFPILKAMADNICPGFGPLLPYMPQNIRADTLLIIAFTNQHYDLIPTLEVLYRSTFPNMLYCGHPHESVEIFKRKYQLVEQRAFSFLPTYTKSTYECVLGAIEMNYEVKGYQVITDETLLESWNTWKLDKEKVWISSTNHDEKVERNTWQKFDPSGRKLARLLEGISATWKLFSYILSGSDSVEVDRKVVVKRNAVEYEEGKIDATNSSDTDSASSVQSSQFESIESPEPSSISMKDHNDSKESLETGETAYVQSNQFRWNITSVENSSSNKSKSGEDFHARPNGASDLQVSDWDYYKIPGLPEELNFDPLSIISTSENETDLSNHTPNDDQEEILVGEDEDENNSTDASMSDIIGIIEDVIVDSGAVSSSVPPPAPEVQDEESETPIDDSVPEEEESNNTSSDSSSEESMENSTGIAYDSSSPNTFTDSILSSTTPVPILAESSVGVPLYHVEHIEPPSPTTWHKPSETGSTTPSTSPATADPDVTRNVETNPKIDVNEEGTFVVNKNESEFDMLSSSTPPTNTTESSTNHSSTSTVMPSTISPDAIMSPGSKNGTSTLQEPIEKVDPISGPTEIDNTNSPVDIIPEVRSTLSSIPSTTVSSSTTSTSTTPSPSSSSSTPSTSTTVHETEGDVNVEIDSLLDSLHEAYYNMLSIVEDYEEINDGETQTAHVHGGDDSIEGEFNNYLEDSPSHRIAPKEFRHIRCTKIDDGHQSDLCFVLRQFILTLNKNNRRDIRLYYDASPVYYIPSSLIKAFYSVGNVLLHHGVMDELALPILFRGLALDDEWIQLNRTIDLSQPIQDSTQFIYPFNLHKVYSDPEIKHDFCSKYLLRILEV